MALRGVDLQSLGLVRESELHIEGPGDGGYTGNMVTNEGAVKRLLNAI